MLDNEFDQIFRDRLLDHPSKVRHGLWKQVHTHLLRHKAFLKWYFAGPAAAAVVVTSYFIVAALHTTPATPATTAHTTQSAHSAQSAQTSPAQTNPTQTSPAQTSPAQTSPAQTNPAPAAASAPPAAATVSPGAPANATPGAFATTPGATGSYHSSHRNGHSPRDLAGTEGQNAPGSKRPRHHSGAHNPNDAESPDASRLTNAGSRTDASMLTSANLRATSGSRTDAGSRTTASGTDAGTRLGAGPTARPPIPAQLTAPAKLATLKTRPAVTANTPNAKNPHQLLLPARPARNIPLVRLDVFGSPEYFTNKDFGLSYGAGAHVTVVFKNHWTITTGVQYLRIAVPGITKDSASWLLPGNIRNIQLPVLLGYTTGNDRFTFSANAGLIFSLSAQARGQLASKGSWSNPYGPSAYFGLNFASRVTNRVSIFAEPYLKSWYPPGRMQFQQLPDRLWSTGLMVGIRYNF